MPESLISAVIVTLGSIILAIVGLWGSKKFKIGQAQDKLVETLRALIEAQDRKIAELTAALAQANLKISQLQDEVMSLKEVTVIQALEIKENKDLISSLSDTQAVRPSRRKIDGGSA